MQIYEHKQVGWALLWGTVLGGIVVAALVALQPHGLIASAAILGGLFLATALLTSLTVRVTETQVKLWFGLGLISKQIPVADIADAQAVRNRWWYGWGIHLTPHGWLWNVAGLDAVEIRFKNDKQMRIGTDEPSRLVAAIRQAMQRRS